jgi:uncharacterized membrane protein
LKTIARTLIILFFVAVVVAGTYAFSTTAWADELAPAGRQFGGGRNQAGSSSEEAGQGQGYRRGQNDGSGGGRGIHFDMEGAIDSSTITAFLKTLVPFTIIIVAVNLVRNAHDSLRRKRRRSAVQT